MSKVLTIETDVDLGDHIEVYFRDSVLHIAIEEPWAGSTETGFGQTTSIELNRGQAILLRKKINEFIRKEEQIRKEGQG